MTIDQTGVIDFVTRDPVSGKLGLVISDHLSWEEDEDEHLWLLQEKLNSYLAFIETGQIHKVYEGIPHPEDCAITIEISGKYPLSAKAQRFFQHAGKTIADAGFKLEFNHLTPE